MGSSAADLTRRVLRHERLIVAGGIALLVLLAWLYLAAGAGMAGAMQMSAMQPPFAALVLMWWLMMVAMMLPSAAPTILLYARVREQRAASGAVVQAWIFAAGYLAVWLLFSLAAAGMQRLLAAPAMALEDRQFASTVLIAAGLYQLSPLKNACLKQCRSPAQFLMRHWRSGVLGAVRVGMLHGAYCLGCCWVLMALLFVGGVMNFAWIAALTLIVGVEKLMPGGIWFGRVAGAALVAWGLVRLLA
jgi:predicted metal-binding membrane protein